MGWSDDAILAAHRSGDPKAFESLVRRHGGRVLAHLERLTGNREDAEDAFQETFRRVHERSEQYRGDGQLTNWMLTIATNLVRDNWRQRSRQRQKQANRPTVSLSRLATNERADLELVDTREKQPPETAVDHEQRQQVRAAVASLPPRQRTILVLAYFEGLSYADVAATLGCGVGTVKTQMFRAVRTLGKKLRQLEGVKNG